MQPRLRNLLQDEPNPAPSTSTEEDPHHVTIPPMRTQRDIHALLDVPLRNTVSGASQKRVQNGILPSLSAATGEESRSNQSTGGEASQQPKKTAKASAVPLAEVLNASSPQPRKAFHRSLSSYHSDGESVRKRRKLHTSETLTRTLPKPAPASRKGGKKRALLPPLLPPLHNPPIGERLIPSMVGSEGPVDPLLEIESGINKDPRSLETAAKELATKEAPINSAKGKGKSPKNPSLEDQLPEAEVEDNASRPGKTGKRSKWSSEETAFLIQGVAKFGIGNWKRILNHPDFKFKEGRNSIDLKDRFRTCFPEEYRKSGSQKGKIDSTTDDKTGKRKGRGSRTTVELDKMGVNEKIPFPKLDRRQRKNFNEEEDAALLQGFKKYGAQWKKIQSDPELGLDHRTRTDLRDRFRNRYSEEFKEAGYKLKSKQAQDSSGKTKETEEDDTNRLEADEVDLQIATGQSVSEDATHPLRLLTAGLYDVIDPILRSQSASLSEDEDDGGIRLSRNIFEWADQNSRSMNAVKSNTAIAQAASEPRTLSSLDQYHINPLAVQNKLPSLLNSQKDLQIQAAMQTQGQQSIAPLSRILNATTLEDTPQRDVT